MVKALWNWLLHLNWSQSSWLTLRPEKWSWRPTSAISNNFSPNCFLCGQSGKMGGDQCSTCRWPTPVVEWNAASCLYGKIGWARLQTRQKNRLAVLAFLGTWTRIPMKETQYTSKPDGCMHQCQKSTVPRRNRDLWVVYVLFSIIACRTLKLKLLINLILLNCDRVYWI